MLLILQNLLAKGETLKLHLSINRNIRCIR